VDQAGVVGVEQDEVLVARNDLKPVSVEFYEGGLCGTAAARGADGRSEKSVFLNNGQLWKHVQGNPLSR
jgi:hypothetical protein